jgi:hypothetical protein
MKAFIIYVGIAGILLGAIVSQLRSRQKRVNESTDECWETMRETGLLGDKPPA